MNMLDAERIKLIKMQMKSVNAAMLKSWKNRTERASKNMASMPF